MTITGSCECGAVVFELSGKLRDVVACHCGQCRKTSGHYWAATSVPTPQLNLRQSKGLSWYRSSDVARRGFCKECGSSLFYQLDDEGRTSVGAGTLDGA
ncbi:MAG: GFA family protein, partial [Rhodobacteraceae bacterium]|nr:GFA family protein [Paracoccaceae bacterium]